MRSFKLTIFTLLLCSSSLYATVFTVTNKADAGIGTLREAIGMANANGTTEVDYIQFNFSGNTEEDRTIVIQSSLPTLTSKITIDGTSQNSPNIGYSHARIIIKTLRTFTNDSIILFSGSGIEDIALYGLYFLDTTDPFLSYAGDVKRAIDIINGKNIIIGDRNKGNVITGYRGYWGSIAIENTDGLKINDNLISVSPYTQVSVNTEAIVLKNVNHIEIGDIDKRNIIFTTFVITYSDKNTLFELSIKNNNVLVHQDGVTTEWGNNETLFRITGTIVQVTDVQSRVNMQVSDNLMSHGTGSGAIQLKFLDGLIHIWHNWFGIDRSGTVALDSKNPHGPGQVPFFAEYVNAPITFGDEDPKLGNLVGYSLGVVNSFNNKSVKVIRNSFKCISGKAYTASFTTIPFVEVLERTPGYIRGKSTALAIVDVFLSDDCQGCSPETYLGTTNADGNGDWKFDLATNYTRSILVNAHVGNQSSEFSYPIINSAKIKITDFDCATTGKIEGVVIANTDQLRWLNEKGEIVSKALILENATPGRYKLVIGEYCPTESEYFTIRDLRPTISSGFALIKNPTCGLADGSITNIFAFSPDNSALTYSWKNQEGTEIATTRDIKNLSAGSYILTVSSQKCQTVAPSIQLKSTNSPSINSLAIVKINTACGAATGSLSNIQITGTGTVKYTWRNAMNMVVGTDKELKNIPAGIYTLQIVDDGGCGPVFSDHFEIIEVNGITGDLQNIEYHQASCKNNDGGISGIVLNGATDFKWINAQGNIVSTTLDLTEVPVGSYRLEAKNLTCNKLFGPYQITQKPNLIRIGGTTKKLKNASYCTDDGRIEVILMNPEVLPISYFWKDEVGTTIENNSLILSGIGPGTYQLFGIDANGCALNIATYSISRSEALTLSLSSLKVENTSCDQATGSIAGLNAKGGNGILSYQWINEAGLVVGIVSQISGLSAGTYTFKVSDASDCPPLTQKFEIINQSVQLDEPQIDPVAMCMAGLATINVKNPLPGINYYLYEDQTTTQPISRSETGVFKLFVNSHKTYFISAKIGSCESIRRPVNVQIGLSTLDIPNSFSPNSDQINDNWIIKGIENSPLVKVKIFNRLGTLVFTSLGYQVPFDGTRNQEPLPIGVYYYVIDFGSDCKQISGSLTLVR